MVSPADSPGGLNLIPSPTFSAALTANSASPSTCACRIHSACLAPPDEDDEEDASRDLKQPCHGWPELVKVMVDNPGFESFQAFRDLNIKSLLYYQAELVQLRKELHALEWRDHRTGGESERLCSSVGSLLQTKERPVEAQAQLKKIKEIREVLKEYSKILARLP
jgi:hypothetical protein